MVYRRMIYEALALVSYVVHACDASLIELVSELESLLRTGGPPEAFLDVAARLREAAYILRERGCLEWDKLVVAADTIEQAV